MHQHHQRLYSLLTENNHGKTYQGKMSPGQNVTQEVRAKRHPVGQGKMSQGNTSQGKTSPRAKALMQLSLTSIASITTIVSRHSIATWASYWPGCEVLK